MFILWLRPGDYPDGVCCCCIENALYFDCYIDAILPYPSIGASFRTRGLCRLFSGSRSVEYVTEGLGFGPFGGRIIGVYGTYMRGE